ncbi:subtilin biosynthesis protein spaC [Streptomyces sp. RS10V-4]|uniref:lanthionine synthetase LanC family protein n=1 Tax=Streptomyces rhizoryzae TaxID=2932493 RepID=UPI0020063E99|nr:lanthionine synthetase LanC family protein [Streptomyces rhizoryzae]MCK7626061.1 subtilin biosynthesis protein spaC [Streptomyces rhizoryzae]
MLRTSDRQTRRRAHAFQDAVELLDRWTERSGTARAPDPAAGHPSDPGVPVLARLVAERGDPAARATAVRATAQWARTAGRGRSHPGLYDGGLAGTLVGLRQAAALHPQLHRVADRLAGRLHERTLAGTADTVPGAVTFRDYDLILGPAGTLLALSTAAPDDLGDPDGPGGPGPSRARALERLARPLAALCEAPDLGGLRTHYPGHPQLGWLHGRVNTGMGHGVAGVLTALAAAVRRSPGGAPEAAGALGRASGWLRRQAFTDARSIRSWDGAGPAAASPEGPRRRQAWCYGAPGVSWALWEAADACRDEAARRFATDAFTSLAAGYHEEFHLFGDHPGDRLGLCHGAAGVLAVADALYRHAGLPAAGVLRARLLDHLDRRRDEIRALGAERTALLGGAAGTLSAVLTATGGDRGWLPCLGLR